MVSRSYVPERGDLVWLDFTPQAGREQAGRRPGLVLSPRSYNEKTSLAVVCPVTSQQKRYPFEVAIPEPSRIRGVILSDHVKSVDWQRRNAERIAAAPASVLRAVQERIALLLGLEKIR